MGGGATHLECSRCARRHDAGVLQNRCPCGGSLLARYDLGAARGVRDREPGLWRYRELLPVQGEPVSLGEAQTPLLACPRLSRRLGVDVWLKDDSPLPSGTFKARGAAVGVSRAAELGAARIVMPSAGNAGAAWALYAARAGLPITVTMSRTAPRANHDEVRLAGGDLVLVDGTLSDAGREAARIAERTGAFLASTFTEPYRLEGKKTAWFEVYEQLGGIPPTVVVPCGGGVAALAAIKAAEELAGAGLVGGDPPAVVGVQPAACAPIVRAFDAGDDEVAPWDADPRSVAAGLRVPGPAEGTLVLRMVRDGGGTFVAVSEAEILDAVADLASSEGVFACPEGAATLPAAARLAAQGRLRGPVVLYNTGAGIKYLGELPGVGTSS